LKQSEDDKQQQSGLKIVILYITSRWWRWSLRRWICFRLPSFAWKRKQF